MDEIVIRSSDPAWLTRALEAYRRRQRFKFIDDAGLGIGPEDFQTGVRLIAAAADRGGFPWREVLGVLFGAGLAAAGIWMVRGALVDPEPTSRLTLLVGGGLLLAMTGGAGALASLGTNFRARWDADGIVVEPGGKEG